jgi:PBP1b-binding outer membrane lipoprotein LpoB
MKRLFIISISALLLASCSEGYKHPMEHELKRIDQALEIMDKYVELKENRISTIMEPLADESLPLNQKYAIYGRLY